jgi:transposase
VIHIRLPEGETQQLEQAFRQQSDPKYKERLQIIRLASRDRPHKQIAEDLAITPRTVQRWLNAYLDRGLDGLRPRKAPGQPGKIPAAMADEIKTWVIGGPAKQGLDRANWTHEELADHLFKTHGIKTSRSAMQRFCQKIGIRPYRPTYRYLRGDPVKQAQAKEEIATLNFTVSSGNLSARRWRTMTLGIGIVQGSQGHGTSL